MRQKFLIIALFLVSLQFASQAQLTNDLNKLLPVDLVDSRSNIFRSVTGMDFMVRIFLTEGIKNIDGCSDAEYGKLSIEIDWYDNNTELGKSQIDMIKMMKADEQQKQNFLGNGPYNDLAGGSLVIHSKSSECINTISGATGRTEYYTDAKFFIYTGSALVKISFTGKVKSETVNNFISNAVGRIMNFNFMVYKNVTANEKS
jgi:hypothetical protein